MPFKRIESRVNVLEAAKTRIRNLFRSGLRVYLSFSCGKDSLVMASITYDLIRAGEIDSAQLTVTFVDEGGHFTQDVRESCRDRIGKKVFCIKGVPGRDRPYTAPPKKMKIVRGGRTVGSCWQYQIGVDSGKQLIMDNLRVQTPGSKYCHFPKRDDYGAAYFKGLLSEHLVYNAEKKQPWSWQKVPGHERNEALDCRNYALAAAKALSPNLDDIDRRLKAARGQAVDAGGAVAEAAPPPRKRKKARGIDGFYDDW